MEENVVIKAIKGLAYGAVCGMTLSVVIYIACIVLEIGNCACNILSCNWQGGKMVPGMWNWQTFWTIFMIATITCSVIGFCLGLEYGLQEKHELEESRKKQAAEEEERRRKQAAEEEERRRKQNAADIQMAVSQQQSSIQTMKKDVYSYTVLALIAYESAVESENAYTALAEAYASNAILKQLWEEASNE